MFILRFVITVGRTLVDSAMKTNTWFITLKYIDNWKQFQTWDTSFIKYKLNYFRKIAIQYESHKTYVRKPHAARELQFAHRCTKL